MNANFPKAILPFKIKYRGQLGEGLFKSCHPIFFDPISFILWLEIKYISSYNSWPNLLDSTSSKFETVLLKSQRGRKTWTWKTIHQEFWGMPWKQPHWELLNEPPLDMSGLTPEAHFGKPLDQVWMWCESLSFSPDTSTGGSFQSPIVINDQLMISRVVG